MNTLIETLIESKESLYLEFKSHWYWDEGDRDLQKSWGELLKDFAALVNCSAEYATHSKYLIVGVDENFNGNRRVRDFVIDREGCRLNKLRDLEQFKGNLLEKLKGTFKKSDGSSTDYNAFTLQTQTVKEKQLLVFTIKPTDHVLILANDLQDKRTTTRKNSVFVRTLKSHGDPEVAIASPEDISSLEEAIRKHKKSARSEEGKERCVEKTVVMFVENNSAFKLETPIKQKDSESGVIFALFPVKSIVRDIDFIYVNEKTSQKKTFEYLKHANLLSDQAKRILLISDKLKKPNLEKLFATTEVYYIQEFGDKHLYSDYLDEDIFHKGGFNIRNYVESLASHSHHKSAFAVMHEWYDKEDSPIVVVKGYGGVGKTTLVKYFLDSIVADHATKVLFINSKEILNDIVKYSNINDVFDFYEVLARKRNVQKMLNRELLQLAIDNGSLLVALDGIDEVIAKAGAKFNVNDFVKSVCESYATGSARTKIIVTCRDYFWDNEAKDRVIDSVQVEPFNKELSEKFFEKKFTDSEKCLRKAMALADEFATFEKVNGMNERVYTPYVLDLIANIIQSDSEFGKAETEMDVNWLCPKLPTDYLIWRVCEREIVKLENIKVDKQLQVLMSIAVKHNGAIPFDSIGKLKHCAEGIHDSVLEKFKGHPVLAVTNNVLRFRYDFFAEFFKGLLISKFLLERKAESLDQDIAEILGDYVRYDNSFTESVCRRVPFDDDLKLFVIELIENIQCSSVIKSREKRKICSSLFIFLLAHLRMPGRQDNIETRTAIMNDIFGTGEIEKLSIINLYTGDSDVRPTLDFSGSTLRDCLFDNYEFFWECKVDAHTRFQSCALKNLIPRVGVRPNYIEGMFDENCDVADVESVIAEQEQRSSQKEDRVQTLVLKIIKYFEQGGAFKYRRISDVRKKFDTKMIDDLLGIDVIQEFIDRRKPSIGKQYRIHPNYSELIKVLEQGGSYVELQRLLNLLKNR